MIAGAPDQVDAVIAAVSAQNRFARRVNMEVASHTALMDPILPDLRAALDDLTPKHPPYRSFRLCSTPPPRRCWTPSTGWPTCASRSGSPTPIAAAGQDHATFIEVSAHPMLTQAITETLESVTPSPQHRHAAARRRRHPQFPYRPQRRTHHRASVDSASPRTSPGPAEHTVAPHPPLDRCRAVQARGSVRNSGAPSSGGDSGGVVLRTDVAGPPIIRRPEPLQTPHGWWSPRRRSAPRSVGCLATIPCNGSGSGSADERVDQAALVNDLAGMSHVLYAPEVSSSGLDAESGYRVFNAARRLTTAMASKMLPPEVVRADAQCAAAERGRARANPAHAVLWGLGRTLALEHPEIWGAVVDVDDSVPAELAARYVLAEAHSGDGEDQVVYRAGVRRVPRLQRVNPPATPPAELDEDSSHLVIGATGNIGPHLIQQLADMGAATIVAVSRNPGSRLR